MLYCMASSAASRDPERPSLADMQFHAKSSWSLISGHRYQVLEEEFFRYVLRPPDDALRSAYGMDSRQIAASSEERRVGQECVSTCRSRWSPAHKIKNYQQ